MITFIIEWQGTGECLAEVPSKTEKHYTVWTKAPRLQCQNQIIHLLDIRMEQQQSAICEHFFVKISQPCP